MARNNSRYPSRTRECMATPKNAALAGYPGLEWLTRWGPDCRYIVDATWHKRSVAGLGFESQRGLLSPVRRPVAGLPQSWA